MCGIVGIYLKNKKLSKDLGKYLTGMMQGMATRGPDSAGFAIYSENKKNKEYKYSLCLCLSLSVPLSLSLSLSRIPCGHRPTPRRR